MRLGAWGLLALLSSNVAWAQDPSPTDLAWLRGEVGDGALAYFEPGEARIWLTELATGNTVQAGSGLYPEFSPDSSKLAWIDGTTAKGRMRKGDSTVHTIASGVTANAGVHWVSDDEVVVVKSGRWLRVSLSGAESEAPALTALGTGGSETDVKLASDGVWSYANGTIWKTSAGQNGDTGGSCSPSLSPDGRSVTGLLHGHKSCLLTRVRSGGTQGQLDWVYDFSGDKGFDNQRWSSNSPDFVVCQDEKYNYMFVQKVGGTYGTRMGAQGSGDEMYGDFTVGDGGGAAWPGTAVEPSLLLSPSSLTFSAVEDGAQPGPQSVSVDNGGDGNLDPLSPSISYGAGAGWLDVVVTGSGNGQQLENDVDITGLSAGSYSATVTVSCGNATNSPRSYSVALNVSAVLDLASISVEPGAATIVEGAALAFTAQARDQNGIPFATTVNWSVSSGGTMTPTSSGGDVTQHSSSFGSDGNAGTFTVTAASGGVSGTAEVTVAPAAQLHLRVNCGDNAATPPGWLDDEAFATGWVDFIFSDTFDTSGVTDPAPASVYQSCRHRIRGVETAYGYDFPGVPDGTYLLRLHFGDGYGPRSIDVLVEGTERISDLDIATATGGAYLALVEELAVTVGGGDGLQITLTDNRADPADFFVNGIEIIGQGSNAAPTVDAGFDQLVQLGDAVFLDGTVGDDGNPSGALTTAWSEVSGPGDVVFTDVSSVDTQAAFSAAGAYTLRLTADDGALQASDDVEITVTEQPAIAIISPNGGEVLVAGTTHSIVWTTVALDDVQIDYSTDNGGSWSNITSSVDTSSPDWEAYPWLVPAEPSTECLLRIAGYFGEAPTVSAASFEIRLDGDAGVGSDAATDDDAGSAPDGSAAADAGITVDAGAGDAGGGGGGGGAEEIEIGNSCDCVGPASGGGLGAALVLTALLWRRRRGAI